VPSCRRQWHVAAWIAFLQTTMIIPVDVAQKSLLCLAGEAEAGEGVDLWNHSLTSSDGSLERARPNPMEAMMGEGLV
jgi:hypothetical protein